MSGLLRGLLQLQLQLQLYHWQTYSHARHTAIDKFLEQYVPMLDTFVETFQGRYGRIQLDEAIELRNMDDASPCPDNYLLGAQTLLTEVLPQYVQNGDVDLLNLRDEMLAQVNQLRYRFTLH